MNDDKKTLICMVGLPRSGKSTWAKSQEWPIVNPDAIRVALHGNRFIASAEDFVWAIAKTMTRALFLAGHNVVILDACNTTRKRRNEWIDPMWYTVFKVIPTEMDICLNRATNEGDDEIMPIIQRMWIQYERLAEDEQLWPG